jgi:prephenate dehydrogenase
MLENIKSVGILGYGSFGQFVASKLPSTIDVNICDKYPLADLAQNAKQVSFEHVVACDVLVLAIPLSSYKTVFEALRTTLPKETLLVDICSVKVIPTRYINKYLPEHENMLITHPLFGPRSAQGSLSGHQLIVTKKIGERANSVIELCESVGLKIFDTTAEDHDKSMALIHALTFFVGRGLSDMKLENVPYETPSYQMLKDLVNLDHSHSDDLFTTIELGNPFAADARKSFINTFDTLNDRLDQKGNPYDI